MKQLKSDIEFLEKNYKENSTKMNHEKDMLKQANTGLKNEVKKYQEMMRKAESPKLPAPKTFENKSHDSFDSDDYIAAKMPDNFTNYSLDKYTEQVVNKDPWVTQHSPNKKLVNDNCALKTTSYLNNEYSSPKKQYDG